MAMPKIKIDIKKVTPLLEKLKKLRKQFGVAMKTQKPGSTLITDRLKGQMKQLDMDLGVAGVTPDILSRIDKVPGMKHKYGAAEKLAAVLKMSYLENWARTWLENN